MLESKRLITARCFIIINWNVCFETIFEMKTNSNVERLAFRIPTTWWYQSQLPNESLNSGNKFHITMIDECLYYFCWWYLRLYTILNEKKVWQERKKKRKQIWKCRHWFAPAVDGPLFSECLNISHLYCEWLMDTSLASIRSQAHIFTRHFHFNFDSIYVPFYRCGYRAKRWTSHWCRSTFPTRHLHPTFPFRKRLKYEIARWNKRASDRMSHRRLHVALHILITHNFIVHLCVPLALLVRIIMIKTKWCSRRCLKAETIRFMV